MQGSFSSQFCIENSCLENGFSIVSLCSQNCKMASVQVWVRAGSLTEGAYSGAGISHFLEHMLFKGAAGKSAENLSAEIRKLGGEINAYTSYDRTVFHIDLPSENLEEAIKILAQMTQNPNLSDVDFDLEKQVILSEIDMCADDSDEVLYNALMQKANPQNALKYPIIGLKDRVKDLKISELKDYHKSVYVPENMFLSVASNFEHSKVLAFAKKYFSKTNKLGKTLSFEDSKDFQITGRELILETKESVSRFQICYKIGANNLRERMAFEALSFILSSSKSSYLQRKFKYEEALVDEIDSQVLYFDSKGFLIFNALVSEKNLVKAKEKILEKLENNLEFVEADLEKFKRKTLSDFASLKNSSSELASFIAEGEFLHTGANFIEGTLKNIEALNLSDLRNAAAQMLENARTVALMSKKKSKFAKKKLKKNSANKAKKIVLKNGAKILLCPDLTDEKVYFNLITFGGGSFYKNKNVSELLAQMLCSGAGNLNFNDLHDFLDERSINFRASAGNNSLSIFGNALASEVFALSNLIGDAVLKPHFKKEIFLREREILISDLQDDLEDPFEFGLLRMRQNFFGKNALSIPPSGLIEDLKKLELSDLKNAYLNAFKSEDTVLCVSGNFDGNALWAHLKEWMEKIPKGKNELPKPQQIKFPSKLIKEKFNANQSAVFLCNPCNNVFEEKEDLACEIFTEILAGTGGQIFDAVRERSGLAYTVSAESIHGLAAGVFYLYALCEKKNTLRVLEILKSEIERIKADGISLERFAQAKLKLKSRLLAAEQNAPVRTSNLALSELYERRAKTLEESLQLLDSIALKDISLYLEKYFGKFMHFILE